METLDAALGGMDPEIRPQDDLFGHVNGRWLAETEIPSDRSRWGPFVQLADKSEQQVRDILAEIAEVSTSSTDGDGSTDGGGSTTGATDEQRKIADLFNSFMDTDSVDACGLDPIRPLLAEVAALDDPAQLGAFLGRFERTGGGGLFGTYITTDRRDSDRYLVHLVQGGLGLPDKDYYTDEKFADVRTAYVDHLATLLRLGEHPDPTAAAQRILDLETRLAEGHWDRADTRDVQKTYNLMTIGEVRALLPGFDWEGWVTALGGDARILAEACVMQPSYFEHLARVLDDTPIEAWRDKLTAHVLRAAAPYLTDDFVQANFEFYGRTLSGTPELRPRWKRAISFVEGAMGEAVGKEYVARHFPPAAKARMDELVANLLAAYHRSISRLDWMTEETKQRAFEKLETFRPKIGYPEEFRDYSALEVTDDLFANVRAAAAFETDRELRKIGSPVDRDEWFMLPQTVNAYYNPGTNEICFPAAILQPPFFNAEGSDAENYGGIGAVIGHEIGHGFDDQGAQYDGHGNLEDWWTSDDKAAFELKSKALINQYDAFEPRDLPGEHVNGALTVGENIGDLGGLTIGHTAFLLAADGEATPEERQRLFLNWALCWRTKVREELARQFLTVDPHSPAEFRANIVRNLDEFHEVFQTVPGDGLWLDEADRVRIW